MTIAGQGCLTRAARRSFLEVLHDHCRPRPSHKGSTSHKSKPAGGSPEAAPVEGSRTPGVGLWARQACILAVYARALSERVLLVCRQDPCMMFQTQT